MKQVTLVVVGGQYLGIIEREKINKVKTELKEKTQFKEDDIVYLTFDLNKLRYPQRVVVTALAETLTEETGDKDEWV